MSYIKYIDISEHQGVIDFERVKDSVDGIIIRAGYGKNNIDKQFKRNISECNRLRIPCGAYWFSYAYTEEMANNEAKYLIEAIKPYRIELPVAFDWEYDSKNYAIKNGVTPTKALVSNMVRKFLNYCEQSGYYSMNYTNPAMNNQYIEPQILSRYDLWLAQWPTKWTENSVPQIKCGIWQYGGSIIPGITGTVDSNRSYKDYYSLLKKIDQIVEEAPKEKTWKEIALDWAKENGINIDKPDETITKAEVLQMLMELIK